MEENRSGWEGRNSGSKQHTGSDRERSRQTQAPTGFEGMNYEQERDVYKSASKAKRRDDGNNAPDVTNS
jgi:hypothetical protein